MAVEAAKKEFYSASITPASSCPGQLFRINRSLTSLDERTEYIRNSTLAVRLLQAFADKV